jgi:hypothetical protein
VKRGLGIFAWAAASVALLVVAGVYADSVFDWETAVGLCKVPVRSITPSPDGKHSVVVYEVYCGPLPPDNTHVSVIPTSQVFSWKRDPDFLVVGGNSDLKVRWTGTTSLEVGIPAMTKAFKQEPRAGDVTVSYRPVL